MPIVDHPFEPATVMQRGEYIAHCRGCGLRIRVDHSQQTAVERHVAVTGHTVAVEHTQRTLVGPRAQVASDVG